jgi:hypothetical protein
MRAKGYSRKEAINRTLQQQVRREVPPLSSTVPVFFSPPPPPPYLILCCRPLVCSHHPCLSSCLPLPLVSRSHHHLSTVALRHSSAGQCHQTIDSCLLPKLLPCHLSSTAVVSSYLPPLHSLMADYQVVMCWPPPPNHPLSSAAKTVVALPLVSSHHLLAGSACRAVI